VDIHQLAPDEPLSPELVLVFPPELRAQALARLGAPVWPTPPRRAVEAPAAPSEKPLAPSLGGILTRIGQLALIFIAVTILVLAMSLVAHAMRSGPQTRPINKAVPPGRSSRSDSPVERYRTEVWTPA
jgi:hypothetical protein